MGKKQVEGIDVIYNKKVEMMPVETRTFDIRLTDRHLGLLLTAAYAAYDDLDDDDLQSARRNYLPEEILSPDNRHPFRNDELDELTDTLRNLIDKGLEKEENKK